jgi:hypothetical protein
MTSVLPAQRRRPKVIYFRQVCRVEGKPTSSLMRGALASSSANVRIEPRCEGILSWG